MRSLSRDNKCASGDQGQGEALGASTQGHLKPLSPSDFPDPPVCSITQASPLLLQMRNQGPVGDFPKVTLQFNCGTEVQLLTPGRNGLPTAGQSHRLPPAAQNR